MVGKALSEGAQKARPVGIAPSEGARKATNVGALKPGPAGIAESEGPRKYREVREISNHPPAKSQTQRVLFHLQKPTRYH